MKKVQKSLANLKQSKETFSHRDSATPTNKKYLRKPANNTQKKREDTNCYFTSPRSKPEEVVPLTKKSVEPLRQYRSRDHLKKVDKIQRKPKKDNKININFQIKNLNIFKSAKLISLGKPLHRKHLTGLAEPFRAPSSKKQPRLPRYYEFLPKKPKTTCHRKTRSQQVISAHQQNNLNHPEPISAEDLSVVAKHAIRSKPGMSQNKPKMNQDAIIALPSFMMSNLSLFGVCDGHGLNGHFVSDFVKEILPENIQYFAIKSKMFLKDKPDVKNVLAMAFKKTAMDLIQSEIDVKFSGSTAVIVLTVDSKLYCANVGDSRAILCRQDQQQKWEAIPLSTDHNADVEKQAQRIIKYKGRLEPYRDDEGLPVGPPRIWLPNDPVPGLAMTRSFGDYVASTVGVTAEPEIVTHKIQHCDKFLIIASDGVWEFLSNEQAMAVTIPCFLRNDADEAVKQLQRLSLEYWKQQDDIIDDISIVVVFFKNY